MAPKSDEKAKEDRGDAGSNAAAARQRCHYLPSAIGLAAARRATRGQQRGAPRQRAAYPHIIQKYRPKNIASAYKPKQREFCQRKQYCDGDAATEDKIFLFLVEEVANRPLKSKAERSTMAYQGKHAARLALRSLLHHCPYRPLPHAEGAGNKCLPFTTRGQRPGVPRDATAARYAAGQGQLR